ncbi:hypothetical protein TNCV_2656011 [Trichonephila clavipes]|nr:hypothetical protein TNCV_2656011 [Trichonephila clavipes]
MTKGRYGYGIARKLLWCLGMENYSNTYGLRSRHTCLSCPLTRRVGIYPPAGLITIHIHTGNLDRSDPGTAGDICLSEPKHALSKTNLQIPPPREVLVEKEYKQLKGVACAVGHYPFEM